MPYIPPKLLYTFLFACQGSAPVYLTLFYSSQLGLKSDQIGLLVAIGNKNKNNMDALKKAILFSHLEFILTCSLI